MYSIYADVKDAETGLYNSICIYNDAFLTNSTKVVNPKLVLEDSAAGSLTITLPPNNVGYEAIEPITSFVTVFKDGEELWSGRVLSEKRDFYNNRTLTCEGELAYFNDTSQPPAEYSGISVRAYIEHLVAVHNSKVDSLHQFQVGAVTVTDTNYPTYYTNYEKTMECINNLVETYGGHIRVRKVNGVRTLDYLEDYPDSSISTQTITFGKNLLDFTRNWDLSEFATVILPLGCRLDDSPIEELDAYLTVAEVNDGSIYVYAQNDLQVDPPQPPTPVEVYGWIVKKVFWNEVDDPDVLLQKALDYLSTIQFDNMVIDLSAVDLHYLNANYQAVRLLDSIRVVSPPHGLNRLFPVTKLEIPLDSPEKTQFKLGATVSNSLTKVNNQTSIALSKKIEVESHSMLEEAKRNAAAVMNMATNGFITLVPRTPPDVGSDALVISNTADWTEATNYWRWDIRGLAHFTGPYDPNNLPNAAITMDGAIVANFITAGTMSADRVRTGIIQDEGPHGHVNFWNLSTGEFQLAVPNAQSPSNPFVGIEMDSNGSLTINADYITVGQISSYDGNVWMDLDTGSFGIYAADPRIPGSRPSRVLEFIPPVPDQGEPGHLYVGTSATFAGIVQAEDYLDVNGYSMMTNDGKFKDDYLDLGNIKLDGQTGDIIMTGKLKLYGFDSLNNPILDALSFYGTSASATAGTPHFQIGWDGAGYMMFTSYMSSVSMAIGTELHLLNSLVLVNRVQYGTEQEMRAISSPHQGTVFFVI